MYKDAARYKIYNQTNRFPPVTRAKGQQALIEVLTEDVEFPKSKQELINDQGWKVIDLTHDKKIHARLLPETLPEKQFKNINEIMINLPKM